MELNEADKMKNEEHEAYLAEIEVHCLQFCFDAKMLVF
jgi:hypothetical protein